MYFLYEVNVFLKVYWIFFLLTGEIPNTSVNGIGAAPAPPTPGIPTVAAAAAAVQDPNGSPQSPYLTAERLEQLNQDQNAVSTASGGAGFLSNDKLQSIISFLDEVQTADRFTHIDSVRTNSLIWYSVVFLF